MQKILCVGDGFGKGHIWPMWPQLLSALLDNYQIVNYSEVGAGNEFIANRILSACSSEKYDIVLVQWALSTRLDIINNNENKISPVILQDKVYNKSYSNIKLDNRHWWLSSNSQTDYVKKYHNQYISREQHKLRSINQIKLVELMLKEIKINKFLFFSSYKLDFLKLKEANIIDWTVWNDMHGHNSMQEYGDSVLPQYKTTEVQPHPLVHLNYIKEIILPKLNIIIDEKKVKNLSQELEKNYKI